MKVVWQLKVKVKHSMCVVVNTYCRRTWKCVSVPFSPPSVALRTKGPNSDWSLTRLITVHTRLLHELCLFFLGGVLACCTVAQGFHSLVGKDLFREAIFFLGRVGRGGTHRIRIRIRIRVRIWIRIWSQNQGHEFEASPNWWPWFLFPTSPCRIGDSYFCSPCRKALGFRIFLLVTSRGALCVMNFTMNR